MSGWWIDWFCITSTQHLFSICLQHWINMLQLLNATPKIKRVVRPVARTVIHYQWHLQLLQWIGALKTYFPKACLYPVLWRDVETLLMTVPAVDLSVFLVHANCLRPASGFHYWKNISSKANSKQLAWKGDHVRIVWKGPYKMERTSGGHLVQSQLKQGQIRKLFWDIVWWGSHLLCE